MKKEAIVVVPGGDGGEVGFALKRFVDKLINGQQVAILNKLASNDPKHQALECSYTQTDSKKHIDVIEAYWGDILNSYNPVEFKPWRKAFWGIELMSFWFRRTTFKAAHKNRYMTMGIIGSAFVLILWYCSLLTLLLSSLQGKYIDNLSFLTDISPVIAMVTVFLGLVPVEPLLRISGFVMKYIKSPALRKTIKNRIQEVVQPLLDSNEYEQVTVFAHSMGSIPTLDYLADIKNLGQSKVRCVSAGASITFITERSKELSERLDLCINNSAITEWVDFFSHEDWMCSYKRVEDYNQPNFKSVDLKFDTSWYTRFSSKVHNQYFDDKRVMERLLLP